MDSSLDDVQWVGVTLQLVRLRNLKHAWRSILVKIQNLKANFATAFHSRQSLTSLKTMLSVASANTTALPDNGRQRMPWSMVTSNTNLTPTIGHGWRWSCNNDGGELLLLGAEYKTSLLVFGTILPIKVTKNPFSDGKSGIQTVH